MQIVAVINTMTTATVSLTGNIAGESGDLLGGLLSGDVRYHAVTTCVSLRTFSPKQDIVTGLQGLAATIVLPDILVRTNNHALRYMTTGDFFRVADRAFTRTIASRLLALFTE